jgi:hypothetical protein
VLVQEKRGGQSADTRTYDDRLHVDTFAIALAAGTVGTSSLISVGSLSFSESSFLRADLRLHCTVSIHDNYQAPIRPKQDTARAEFQIYS